jgi:serine/threonine-protein kinase
MLAFVPSSARYRTLFTLARGGMGRIDLAQRREGLEGATFERLVAIKRLHEAFAHDEELVGMLVDEARIAGTIRHANVVSVLDVGRDDEGPFLVMDLVEGLSLQQLCRAFASEGLLPLQISLRILRQVAAGLHAAHESRDARGEALGVVHRDVSPQNVLVGFDGVVRLTDFGIAKAIGASSATSAGVVKGKLRYMAPEQLAFGAIDRRTDLYALGVLAFELFTGHHPFEGSPEDVARATLSGVTPDLGDECPELPSALVELLFRLLARDVGLRPTDAAEVGRVLDEVLAELVAEEGTLDLAALVETRFSAERAQLRARIRDALDAPPPTPAMPSDEASPATRVEVVRHERSEERREPRPRRALAFGVVLVVLALASVGWLVSTRTTSDTSTGADARPDDVSATPAETSAPVSPSASPPASAERTAVTSETPREPSERVPSVDGATERTESVERNQRPEGVAPRRRPSTPARVGAWSWEHESR